MTAKFVHEVNYERGDDDVLDPIVIEFGNFRLDVTRRLLWVGETPKPITEKLLRLLLVFVRSGGAVISKREVAEAVWPGRPVSLSNFNQHIFLLRQLLGESARDHAYIITHPGKGFHFVVSGVREESATQDANAPKPWHTFAR